MKKLPEQIVVRWEEGDEPYLSVFDNEHCASERGEKHAIGVYRLVETKTVELVAKVTNPEAKEAQNQANQDNQRPLEPEAAELEFEG